MAGLNPQVEYIFGSIFFWVKRMELSTADTSALHLRPSYFYLP